MSKAKRLDPVVRINEEREQEAARLMGICRQELASQQQQLSQLEQYRQEYFQSYQQRCQAGVSAVQLQELQRFLNTLNEAIKQQREQIGMTEQRCKQKEEAWWQARSRSQAIDKVVDRIRDEERQENDRREQKELDEHAQRSGGKVK